MKKEKQVDFAYPTSINAEKFGYSKTGCWVLKIGKAGKPLNAIKAFETQKEAVKHACDYYPKTDWSTATVYNALCEWVAKATK